MSVSTEYGARSGSRRHQKGRDPWDPGIDRAPMTLEDLHVPERVDSKLAYGRDIYQDSQVNVLLGRFVRIRGDLLMAAPGVLEGQDTTRVAAAVVCAELLREAKDLLERRKVPLTVVTHQLSLADRALVSLYSESVMEFRVQTLAIELDEADPECEEQRGHLDRARESLEEGNRLQAETAVKEVLSHLGEESERQLIADDLQVSRLSKAIGYVALGWVALLAIVPFVSSVQTGTEDQLIWPLVDLFSEDKINLFLGAVGLSCVGAVGGIVSGMFSVRDSATSLRDYRTSVKRMMLKPLFGAVAALTVYFFLSANLISGVAVTSAGTYVVAAFLAGFSERYFLRIVDAQSKETGSADRAPGNAPSGVPTPPAEKLKAVPNP